MPILKFSLALLSLAVVPLVHAEDRTAQWNEVELLGPGARVGVIQSDLKRVEGRFKIATDTSITLMADRDITVQRDQVVRVYTKGRMNRLMRTLVGAGIGLVAGAILNATVGERFRNEGQDQAGALIGGATAVGAGIGALTGSGYRTVYRKAAP